MRLNVMAGLGGMAWRGLLVMVMMNTCFFDIDNGCRLQLHYV